MLLTNRTREIVLFVNVKMMRRIWFDNRYLFGELVAGKNVSIWTVKNHGQYILFALMIYIASIKTSVRGLNIA